MKQLLISILSTALLAGPALADEAPAPAPDAKKADEAKPCDGKKGDCPDCADHGGKGEGHGGCCEEEDDDEGCCGGQEAKPCDGHDAKPCDPKFCAECPDCKAGKPCKDCKECQAHAAKSGEGHEAKPCEGHDAKDAKPCEGKEHGEHDGGPWSWAKAIKPHALLQTQIGLFAGADNQIARGDVVEAPGNFILRRARLGASGHISPRITWNLMADLAEIAKGGSPITQANASLHFLRHQDLTVGAQMVPFSRFAMIGSGDQALAQRPKAADAMSPFYQIGVSLHGHYDLIGLQWWAGAYNSFERDVNYFGGFSQNAWLFLGQNGNRARGYSVAGRIQAEPLGPLGGQAASRGLKDKFRFEIGGGGYYNDAGGSTSWAASADVHLKSHGAHLLFEYLMDSASPKSAPTVASTIPDTVKRQAIIAELGYAWWRFNAAARVELIDPNKDLKDNHDETIISGALGWQLTQNRARVQLQYDHRTQATTPALKDDTLFAQFQVKL